MFVVGQFRRETADGAVWDFQGVFQTRELAIKACRAANYFILPVNLDEELPNEITRPAVEYPLA